MTSRSDILFINRDSDFLEAMAGFLRKAGFVVHTAMDMRNALAKMSENPVGLIICDNVLQDISGYDFLRFIKNDPLRESIPFIFFVPINDQGRAAKAFELGAADFLVYPMDVDDLANRVQEIIVPGEDDPASAAPDVEHQSSAAIPSAEQQDFPSVNHSAPGSILPSPVVPMQLFPSVRIDLSRDGLLWMPGNVKNLFTNGILVVTALLGKPGVSLHVKFPLPEGRLTIRGQIKQVVFDNFDKPAGIGITFEKSPQWTQVLEHLQSLMEKEEGRVAADIPHTQLRLRSKEMSVEMTGTLLLPGGPEELSTTLVLHTTDDSVKSYHERFYHSLVGKQLDSYRALSFIGAGTMGGVFKGWDAALERIVALKVISYELSAREEFRKLFIKEARLISQLDYPNIAHIYAIGNTNDILYFAMEFINGETLGDLIKKHGNLYTLRGLDYLITVCTTLDFVSGQNIIHRDIKPENIIINDKGVLKIVDFGVAKRIEGGAQMSVDDGIVGSPLYISPDAVLQNTMDYRSDIYSLGATFYHVFFGEPPFQGDNAKEILLKHVKDLPVPLSERNPRISPVLSGIVGKMMAKSPDARYQSYQDILKDLKNFRQRVVQAKKQKAKAGSRVGDNGKRHEAKA